MNGYRLIGVNDEQDWCCLCGKTGLKRVYWLDRVDADGTQVGAPSHYGSECAAQLLSVHASTPTRTRKLLDSCVQETVLAVEKAELDRRSAECVLADVMGDGRKGVYVPSDMVSAEWTPDNLLTLRQRMKAQYPLLYCQSMTELKTKVLAQLRAS